MSKLLFYTLILWLFCINIASSQIPPLTPSSRYVIPNSDNLLENIKKTHEIKKRNLPVSNRQAFEKIYQQHFDTLTFHLNNGHYLFDDKIYPYYKQIADHIISTNPMLADHKVHLLISRRADPNASSMGYSIINLHIGLSRRFENESQAAFVLCHELAHHYLNHIDQSIAQYVESIYGRPTQQQLKKIARSDNQKVRKGIDLLRHTVYAMNNNSRSHEREADSLALLFMKNTVYDEKEALTALALLDSVDREKYRYELPLKQAFDSPEYPFKDYWLKPSQLMQIEDKEAYWNEDSLKTHPDCTDRIKALATQINDRNNKKQFVQPPQHFQEMVSQSDIELIERELYFRRYGRCLYESLLLLSQQPHNQYLQATIGQCLYGIYQAQKNHQLSKYVDLPAPRDSKEYRQLLDFLHNLRLKEIAQIGYYFLKHNYTSEVSEDFLYAFAALSKVMEVPEQFSNLKNDYLLKYPQGRFVQQIKQL
ncbi:M48 family metalloprotease [Rhodocytophaga rosea]|uniref:M48 family metalloprotease n=1 Tax=Rhodocytophaga rosea TaxID=2704465 RepID=A0A6C0GKS8_9BACT|nr:M48 family metalloprotease [Rhodocytophaga rosea]QHT68579.1 M48 family metalloprotease [Rhodocytophaga rosea]